MSETVEEQSLRIERETGLDSIATIERVYGRTDSGAYECPWPSCSTVRHDPVKMWDHISKSAPGHRQREETKR
jgi:hypothetical protein